MPITRREAVAALMANLYALPNVTTVSAVPRDTLFILLTVNDDATFNDACIKSMQEEFDDVCKKTGCPNMPVLALAGGRVHVIRGNLEPDELRLPGP